MKVRIAGNVARTEIDETFANDTDDELEGIYRFPLPPGAQIERLALEVDGKLVDGEFVDKAKARGDLARRDPERGPEGAEAEGGDRLGARALARSGAARVAARRPLRAQDLPDPEAGLATRASSRTPRRSRRSSGVRRYVYPLPQGSSSKLTIDSFSVDAQVLGHDAKVPRSRRAATSSRRRREGGAERAHRRR